MNILVTGGAGFIGSHVVDLLVADGHEVVVLDALSPTVHQTRPGYLNANARYVTGDVRDRHLVGEVVDGVDAVAHLAAKVGLETGQHDAVDYVADNDLGTAVVLEQLAARHFAGRFVLASSMVIYGEGRYRCSEHGESTPGPRNEDDLAAGRFEPSCLRCGAALHPVEVDEATAADPRNVYAATKLHQEHLATIWSRVTGASAIALRYHNVYGPRMPRDTPYAGVAALFASRLANGDAPLVFEDGGQRRDFVHVADVARATVLALVAAPDSTSAANVASGRPTTIGEVAGLMSDAFGAGAPRPIVTGQYRLGDVRHIVASPRHASQCFGFSASVPLERGIAELRHELADGSVANDGRAGR